MLNFSTRAKARAFAGGIRKVIDNGAGFAKRWGVKVV